MTRALLVLLKTALFVAWCVLALFLTYTVGTGLAGYAGVWGVPNAAWMGYAAAGALAMVGTRGVALGLYKDW